MFVTKGSIKLKASNNLSAIEKLWPGGLSSLLAFFIF